MPKMTLGLPCHPKPGKGGIYYTSWTARDDDGNALKNAKGKSYSEFYSFGTKDEGVANAAYIKFLADFGKEKKAEAEGEKGRRTVHWCIDYYLDQHVEAEDAGVVAKDNPRRVCAMWKAFFPPTKMAHEINKRLTDDPTEKLDLDRWAERRRKDRRFNKGGPIRKNGTPKINRPIQESTLRYERNILNIAINFCIKKGVLSNLDRPQIVIGKPGKGRLGHIDEDQFLGLAALLEKANAPQMHGREGKLPGILIWAWTMFETGCRPNEAMELKWDKVDLDRDRVIDFTIEDRPETCKVRNPHAPITDALLAILRRAKEERVSEWVCIKPVAMAATFKVYCERAGFPVTGPKKITAHSMRHSRISLAVASGMSAPEASDLFSLDIQTMMDTYYHGTAQQRAKNANRASDQRKLLRGSIKAVK